MEEPQAGAPAAAPADSPPAGTASPPEATAAGAGQQADQQATPEAGTAPPAEGATAAAEEVPANETPEAKSRRERQAEKRKQPAPPPPKAPTPEEIIAEYRRSEEARQKAEAEQKQRYERNARLIGEDTVTVNGETMTRYEQLRREAFATVPPLPEYGYVSEDEFKAHKDAVAKRDKASAQFQELTERRQLIENDLTPVRQMAQQAARTEAMQWFGDRFEAALAERGVDVQKVIGPHLSKPDPMPSILADLTTAIEAPHLARISELEEQHAADQSQIDALTRQLGGAAPQPLRGGTVAGNGHIYTRAELASMPIHVYRQNRSEIERQEAAGLIR